MNVLKALLEETVQYTADTHRTEVCVRLNVNAKKIIAITFWDAKVWFATSLKNRNLNLYMHRGLSSEI